MQKDPVSAIADSPYFSAEWYLRTYPDVEFSGMDPVQHYLHVGAPLGRDPGPGFSASFYLERHADVREAGHNPLWHYELFGRDEGREILPSQPCDDTRDTVSVASEIDRTRPSIRPSEARKELAEIFSQRLDVPPLRIMTNYNHELVRRTVDCLGALGPEEMAARCRLASVIMPTYNRADRIGAAIRSVLDQSHQALELIVVDDGSTDGTRDVLATVDDPRIRTIHLERSGVSRARNAGLAEAQGEIIFYLDSDNIWTRDFVRLMLITMEVAGIECAYSALSIVNSEGRVSGYRGEPFDRSAVFEGNYIDLNVFCHTRELYNLKGGFDPYLRRMVDWDLILRYTQSIKPVFCPFIGCHYTDSKHDDMRISNSEPYLFHKIVQQKNAGEPLSAEEALHEVCMNVAIRAGMPDCPVAHAFAAEFTAVGHHVRIDPPESWTVRHPHQDDIVLLCPGAFDSPRSPEQVHFLCPKKEDGPPASEVRQILSALREKILAWG